MDFVKREKVEIGTKLIVEIASPKKLLTMYITGSVFKDEPVLLTVTSFGKRDFTAIDRHGGHYYFSNKTGKRNGFYNEFAEVATDSQIAEIMAIIDYNQKVAAVNSVLNSGPGPAWDIVIAALTAESG